MNLSDNPVVPREEAPPPDWRAEMRALVDARKTLTWLSRDAMTGPHRAVWMEEDGIHDESRDRLEDLVKYLRAHFGAQR